MHDLQGEARFWAVDLYGFGQSPRPREAQLPDIATHTALLTAFCEQHNIRPSVIMGHSMGGMLTLKLALAQPEWVRGIVLMSSVVTGRYGVPLEISRLFGSKTISSALQHAKPLWDMARSEWFPPLFTAPWYMDVEAAARTRLDFQRTAWSAAMGGLTSLARENLESYLPRLHKPSLIIVGKHDFTVPTTESRKAARLLPQSQLVELAHSHHHPLDEEPTIVIDAVRGFLRRVNGAAHLAESGAGRAQNQNWV